MVSGLVSMNPQPVFVRSNSLCDNAVRKARALRTASYQPSDFCSAVRCCRGQNRRQNLSWRGRFFRCAGPGRPSSGCAARVPAPLRRRATPPRAPRALPPNERAVRRARSPRGRRTRTSTSERRRSSAEERTARLLAPRAALRAALRAAGDFALPLRTLPAPRAALPAPLAAPRVALPATLSFVALSNIRGTSVLVGSKVCRVGTHTGVPEDFVAISCIRYQVSAQTRSCWRGLRKAQPFRKPL